MPFFSIVIPSYNRASFLPQTITSVLKQDYDDFEILVVDDGSTDNTEAVVRSFTDKDPRVTYYYRQNAERGASRNFGFGKATGDFVVFLDSDDVFLPSHLSTLKKTIAEHPKLNFFASHFNFKDEGQVFSAPIEGLSEGTYDYHLLERGNPFACNICVRRKNPALRLFPEDRKYSGMEDWLFLFANLWSQDLFLSAKTTVQMNEHANRSMRFNKDIIEKRLLATDYILSNFSLYKAERKKITGYTAYFCAIHSYLDNDRARSVKWVLNAISSLGLRKDLLSLLLKLVFGRKIIGKIKEVISHR